MPMVSSENILIHEADHTDMPFFEKKKTKTKAIKTKSIVSLVQKKIYIKNR